MKILNSKLKFSEYRVLTEMRRVRNCIDGLSTLMTNHRVVNTIRIHKLTDFERIRTLWISCLIQYCSNSSTSSSIIIIIRTFLKIISILLGP